MCLPARERGVETRRVAVARSVIGSTAALAASNNSLRNSRQRLGEYIVRQVLSKGKHHEGTSFCQEDVRQMQDHSSPRQGVCDLRESASQAASGLKGEQVGTYPLKSALRISTASVRPAQPRFARPPASIRTRASRTSPKTRSPRSATTSTRTTRPRATSVASAVRTSPA